MANTVRVSGLAELQRAFRKMSGGLDKELRKALRKAADPVADLARQKALGEIRNMPRSPRWAEQRVGVTGRAVVYIVPRARGRGGSGRGNLKGLLLNRAMDPAAEEKAGEVEDAVGEMIDDLAGASGF